MLNRGFERATFSLSKLSKTFDRDQIGPHVIIFNKNILFEFHLLKGKGEVEWSLIHYNVPTISLKLIPSCSIVNAKFCDWYFLILISEPLIILQTIWSHHSVSVNWLRIFFSLRRSLSIICIFYLFGIFICMEILFGWRNQEEWDGWVMWREWEKKEGSTGFWCRNLTERNHVEGVGGGWSLILTLWPWSWTLTF